MPDDIKHFEARLSVVTLNSPPKLTATIATPTVLEFRLSDGRIISYPKEPIPIGNLTYSYKEAGDGKYLYEYSFDNRQVEMIRVGEFTHDFGCPVMNGPEGWIDVGPGWSPSLRLTGKPVARNETAKYTIVSEFLPGPLLLHIAGAGNTRDGFTLPFSTETSSERYLLQKIWHMIQAYGDSCDPLVIGPAFKPKPTELEVRNRIRLCIEYGLEFLRPLDDKGAALIEAEGAVAPTTEFETKVLDCLKVAIRSMIVYDPIAVAAALEAERVEMRGRLSGRGVTTLEEAKSKLRLFRTAENILEVVLLKVGAARTNNTPNIAQMGQLDERLLALTNSRAFVRRYPALAERLPLDQPYYMKLIAGIRAAQLRLRDHVDALHKGYDLKVSTEACQEEIAKVCVANLAQIQAESVFGIHLTEEEATASLAGKNWELIRKNPIERIISRIFTCSAGNHHLRAAVITDSNDERIVGIRLQLIVKGSVRCHDGSERPELFDGDEFINVFIDEGPLPL